MSELTREERVTMRELATWATEGPWEACIGSGEHVCTALHTYAAKNKHGEHPIIADFLPGYLLEENLATDDHLPNLGFVEAARSFIPKALDALDAAEASLAAHREALDTAALDTQFCPQGENGWCPHPDDPTAKPENRETCGHSASECWIAYWFHLAGYDAPDPARGVTERLAAGAKMADLIRSTTNYPDGFYEALAGWDKAGKGEEAV